MSLRIRALLTAIGSLLVGGLAYLLGVGSFLGQRAEASVLEASDFTANPPAPLSLVSPFTVVVSLVVIGLIALWAHGIWRALLILSASSVALIASQLLKESWLERPQLVELDALNTFPSGHMTVFAVLAAGIIWALPRGARSVAAIMSALVLAVVAWQLLEYGWHRPSDLLGAQALALSAFSIAAWLGPRSSRRDRGKANTVSGLAHRIARIALVTIGAILIALGVALVAFAAWSRSDALMLTAGEIALVGVSAVTASLFAKLCP